MTEANSNIKCRGVLGSETDLLRSSLTVQFLGLELPGNRNPPLLFAVNLASLTEATALGPLLGVFDHLPQLHGLQIQRGIWWWWLMVMVVMVMTIMICVQRVVWWTCSCVHAGVVRSKIKSPDWCWVGATWALGPTFFLKGCFTMPPSPQSLRLLLRVCVGQVCLNRLERPLIKQELPQLLSLKTCSAGIGISPLKKYEIYIIYMMSIQESKVE